MGLPRPKIIEAPDDIASKKDYQLLCDSGEVVKFDGLSWVVIRKGESFFFYEMFIIEERE